VLNSVASNRMNQISSKERDAETGLDYFGARYLSSAQGRFTSTDPYFPQLECKNALCFSGYIGNPQNWNRYTYTRNNPLAFVDSDGEKTELAVGRNTADNPFGHISIIINGKVYSYGTNYNGGPTKDWGANANVFLNAQSGARQTDLIQLNIKPEQEQSLQQYLDANNPNAQGAPPYDALGNSCVTVGEKALQDTGILPTPQPGPEVIGRGGAVYQRGADKSITPNQLAERVNQQPGLVQQTTASGQQKTSVFRSFLNLFKNKTGSE
jgi:RHS repeat-associated protein